MIKKHIKIILLAFTIATMMCFSAYATDETKPGEVSILRIHGSDRFETAIKISNQIAKNSDFVLLANAYNYPDGLTGSTLSGGKYPLLFTETRSLNEKTKAEIERLSPQMVILLGGEASISKGIEEELNRNFEVMRIGGADRYETMELIREYKPKTNIILASGTNFADALVSAPLAISKDANIVLTPKQSLGAEAIRMLEGLSSKLYMIGGDNVISGAMRDQVKSMINTTELYEVFGENRYSTSVKIAEQFFSDTVIIASGESFPDSLSGSVLAGSIGAPILLSACDKLDQSARDYLKYNKDHIENVILLGGEQTLSQNVVDECLAHISGTNYVDEKEFSDTLLEYRTVSISSPIYSAPDETTEPIGQTYEGEYLQCYGESGGYLKIRRDAQFSYIHSNKTASIQDENAFKVVGGMLILNKKYHVPSDYAPGVDPDAGAAFNRMQQVARAAGLGMYLESSYRSYWYQSSIYNSFFSMDGWYANMYSAQPGHSEHQSGRAFDVSSYGEGLYTSFENTATFSWLKENAAGYGFILRYPYGKESVTGYIYEPWHYTYVGIPLAQQIKDSGLAVEEYFKLN